MIMGKKQTWLQIKQNFRVPVWSSKITPNFYNYEYLDTNQTERSYNNREYFYTDKQQIKIRKNPCTKERS